MIGSPRLALGNVLASTITGRRDLSPDARLLGASQARADMPVGTGPAGHGNLIASALGGGNGGLPPQPDYYTPPIWGGPAPSGGPDAIDLPDVQDVPAEGPSPKFFDKNGGHRMVLGILGDALMGAVGKPGMYAQSQMQQRQREAEQQAQTAEWGRQDRNRTQDRAWAVEDREYNANKPESFMSGRDRVRYDPRTGQAETVYDGQEDFEVYADALGLDRDSAEYRSALQDYVLRGNGPTAFKYDQGLEAVRHANRADLRATPTFAQANPRPRGGGGGGRGPRAPSPSSVIGGILQKVTTGAPLSAGEERAWNMHMQPRSRGGRGSGGDGGGMPVVSSPAAARKLPPGTKFKTPDGRVMTR